MHRIYLLPLILLLSLTVVIVAAQENGQPDSPTPLPVVTPHEPDVSVEKTDIVGADLMGLTSSPFSISASDGSDLCSTATVLTAADSGSQMDVAAMTQSVDDPDLGCMWGTPTSSQGYRTVWYQFTPSANGIMTISTLPASTLATNAYDTVLAVHTGACGADLVTVACNDDRVGFSSTVTLNVRRNTTYYIEVADWQAGGNAIKMLDLSIQVDPFTSLWQNANTQPATLSSRQASVVVGSDLYLIGGRGSGGSILNSFQKLDTSTGNWETLSSMPANDQGNGLLNTTAVYLPANGGLNARIYIPGGSASSDDTAYSREHQYYEFRENLSNWNTAPELVGGAAVTETFAYAAAAPNNAKNGYYLTGGVVGQGYPLTTTSTVRDQVLFYQPSDDSWVTETPMISPRYGHVAANVWGRLCVAGGLNIDAGAMVLIPNGECASGSDPETWYPTGNMRVPRYFAHSSVSPAGKWYVYGGIDATGAVVPEVEYYDRVTNSWSVLGLLYDLGGQDGKPLVWPAGGFVGNYLWATSGSYDPTGSELNPQVGKVQILGNNTFLPLVLKGDFGNNHSLADAWPIPLNSTISQNFSGPRALVNFYSFTVPQLSQMQVSLTGVASTANVNLYLYGENKKLLQSDESPFPGINKTITRTLNPGQYYVAVRYKSSSNFPNDLSDYYQLRVGG